MFTLTDILQCTFVFEDISQFLQIGDLQIFALCSASSLRAVFQQSSQWQRDGIDFMQFPFWLLSRPGPMMNWRKLPHWLYLRRSGRSFGDRQLVGWVGRIAKLRKLLVGYSVELTDTAFRQLSDLARRPVESDDFGGIKQRTLAQLEDGHGGAVRGTVVEANNGSSIVVDLRREHGSLKNIENELTGFSASEAREKAGNLMHYDNNRFGNLREFSVGWAVDGSVLEMVNITNDGLLGFLSVLPNLESLTLRGLTKLTVDLLATLGKSCQKLRFFDVTGCVGIQWRKEDFTTNFLAKCVHLEVWKNEKLREIVIKKKEANMKIQERR